MTEEKSKPSLIDKLLPISLIALVGMSFAVGVLWQKVSSLEKGGSGSTTATAKVEPLSVESIKKYAKELKLNEKDFNKCLDDGKYAAKIKQDMAYGEQLGVTGTPAFYINGKFLGGAYPYEFFKEIIDLELQGKGKTLKEYSDQLQKAYTDEANRSFNFNPKTVEIGDAPVKGDNNAKVTIVEFSDFECPFCQRHFTQTNPKLIEDYVNTGKAKLAFKYYPLTFHPHAQKAAEAAECAKEQGKFWEMHDKLFEMGSQAAQ